ncbi:MAG: DUF2085 domain-containing protein [Clostridia bacterium]|nr:DUF2085 domain-containing protein [Clostridia bacterium]
MNAAHGLFIGGFCLPLCARCFFIVLFSFVFLFLIRIFKIKITLKIFLSGLIFALPCVIDGVLQYFFNVESNTFKRIITGSSAGITVAVTANYFSGVFIKG